MIELFHQLKLQKKPLREILAEKLIVMYPTEKAAQGLANGHDGFRKPNPLSALPRRTQWPSTPSAQRPLTESHTPISPQSA
jgi:hypothetical protein